MENLPDHLIHQIMHLLPNEEAAKFNVLSKSLYSCWLSFPNLYFSFKSIPSSDVSYKTFFNSVQKTLQLRGPYIKGSLHNLTLSYTEYDKPYSPHYPLVFDVLLNFAIEEKVKEVNFDLDVKGDGSQDIRNFIPNNWNYGSLRPLFSSQFLTVLKLCGVNVPRADALITCPKLEKLVIKYCQGFQTVNVSCTSSLKKVELECCDLEELQILLLLLERKVLNSFKSEVHEEYDELRQCKLGIYYCWKLKVLKFLNKTIIRDCFSCRRNIWSFEIRKCT